MMPVCIAFSYAIVQDATLKTKWRIVQFFGISIPSINRICLLRVSRERRDAGRRRAKLQDPGLRPLR